MRPWLVFLSVLLLLPLNARAYIDVNAGSLLSQLVLAGLGGLGAVLKILWSHRRRPPREGGNKPSPPPGGN
ncbi:MAG TPA: hypothetical protein PKZ00_09715 [Elusimicrobiota bacterium]|nr:hypothetical protein [Elusimicrobiota bacterium]